MILYFFHLYSLNDKNYLQFNFLLIRFIFKSSKFVGLLSLVFIFAFVKFIFDIGQKLLIFLEGESLLSLLILSLKLLLDIKAEFV